MKVSYTHTHTRTLINFCNNIIICIDNSHHQMNCDIFSQRFWLIIIYATFFINRCAISTMYMNTLCLWIWRNQLVPGYINRITSCLSAFTMRNDKSNNKWNRWRMKKKKVFTVHVAKSMLHSKDVTWFDWNRIFIPIAFPLLHLNSKQWALSIEHSARTHTQ